LGLIRCDSGRTEDRRALQHRYVAHEIALARVSQIVFGSVARLERFEFAAQNNCQSEIALPGLKDEIATLHDTTLSEGLKQRKLMIVQFWKRDAFSIAVEPFVLLVVSHLRNLRVTQHNPNLTHSGAHLRIISRPDPALIGGGWQEDYGGMWSTRGNDWGTHHGFDAWIATELNLGQVSRVSHCVRMT